MASTLQRIDRIRSIFLASLELFLSTADFERLPIGIRTGSYMSVLLQFNKAYSLSETVNSTIPPQSSILTTSLKISENFDLRVLQVDLLDAIQSSYLASNRENTHSIYKFQLGQQGKIANRRLNLLLANSLAKIKFSAAY